MFLIKILDNEISLNHLSCLISIIESFFNKSLASSNVIELLFLSPPPEGFIDQFHIFFISVKYSFGANTQLF